MDEKTAYYINDCGAVQEYTSETILPHGNFSVVYKATLLFYKIKVLKWEHGTKRYTNQLYQGKQIIPAELKGYSTIQDALVTAFHRLRDHEKESYIGVHDVIRILEEIPTELLQFILPNAFIPKFTRENILAKLDEDTDYDFEGMRWDEITDLIVDKIKAYKDEIGKDDTIEGAKKKKAVY